jgi:hypothetical protein
MLGYFEIITKIKEVSKMNFVKTHRSGPTGIGKTLEDLLGITENNIPGPNAAKIELKSARKNVKSMLTLFTKAPLPQKANSVLLKNFGYKSYRGDNKKRLCTTVNAIAYNRLKGELGFKIDIQGDKVNIITSKEQIVCYWDKTTLETSFNTKLPKVLYVKAETKGRGVNEEFWFNEAWLLSGFSFENFIKLLLQGVILVDIRMVDHMTAEPDLGFSLIN